MNGKVVKVSNDYIVITSAELNNMLVIADTTKFKLNEQVRFNLVRTETGFKALEVAKHG